MTWLDSGGQRAKVKVTAGRRSGEGVHVDAGELPFIYFIIIIIIITIIL